MSKAPETWHKEKEIFSTEKKLRYKNTEKKKKELRFVVQSQLPTLGFEKGLGRWESCNRKIRLIFTTFLYSNSTNYNLPNRLNFSRLRREAIILNFIKFLFSKIE